MLANHSFAFLKFLKPLVTVKLLKIASETKIITEIKNIWKSKMCGHRILYRPVAFVKNE